MYYDDQARRFNFVSGLLFGAVLGAGLALLAVPQERSRRSRSGGRATRALKKRAGRRIHRLREGVAETVSEAVSSGRGYLRR